MENWSPRPDGVPSRTRAYRAKGVPTKTGADSPDPYYLKADPNFAPAG
jgi:hypothetical protein